MVAAAARVDAIKLFADTKPENAYEMVEVGTLDDKATRGIGPSGKHELPQGCTAAFTSPARSAFTAV